MRHSYFEKKMRSQILTMKKSSQSENSKVSILTNELNRRFQMMDDLISIEEKVEKIDRFSQQLINSGYQWSQIRDIVVSSLRHVKREERVREKNGNARYRTGEESLPVRLREKLLEVTEWYKRDGERKKEGEEEIEQQESKEFKNKSWKGWRNSRKKHRHKKKVVEERVMEKLREEKEAGGMTELKGILFVPHTEMSELAKHIREKLKAMETVSCLRIKVIERTGEKIVDALHRSNPWEDLDCVRDLCFFCGGGDEKMVGKCKQRGVDTKPNA